MGRRGIRVDETSRWVFNRLAEAYRARPGYPDALSSRLAALAGGPGARVADLGAGTGHLALPLAERGLVIDAVEPARAMLAVLEERARERGLTEARLRLVHAAAEAPGLPDGSIQLALLADALHWVDPELTGRAVGALLAPEGTCAIVTVSLADGPFERAVEALLARYNPRARRDSSGAARQLLSLATGGGRIVEEVFDDVTHLEPSALLQLLASYSYVGPARGPLALAELQAEVRTLSGRFAQTGNVGPPGSVAWRRRFTLAWAR